MFKAISSKHLGLALALGLGSTLASAGQFEDVPRPIDDFYQTDSTLAVSTLRDETRQQGNIQLGRALLTIGREDLLGLNLPLNSFDVGTLEVPIGGNFDDLDMQRPLELRPLLRAARQNAGVGLTGARGR